MNGIRAHQHSHSVHEGQSTFILLVEFCEDVLEELRVEASFLVKRVRVATVLGSVHRSLNMLDGKCRNEKRTGASA